MRKTTLLSFLSISALLTAFCTTLISCDDNRGRSIDHIHGATDTDTMLYYYGQLKAADYWQSTAFDSTIRTSEGKQRYLEGVKNGLNLLHDDDYAYNRGLEMGLEMARIMQRLSNNYNIKSNVENIYDGFAYGLSSDTSVNEDVARRNFYRVLTKLRDAAEAHNVIIGSKHLRESASRLKMSQISRILWGKTLTPGIRPLSKGMIVNCDIHLYKLNNTLLDIPFPSEIEIGNPYVTPVISEALAHTDLDGTSQFATTAMYLLGGNCEQFNVLPSDAIIFTIRATQNQPAPQQAVAATADASSAAAPGTAR